MFRTRIQVSLPYVTLGQARTLMRVMHEPFGSKLSEAYSHQTTRDVLQELIGPVDAVGPAHYIQWRADATADCEGLSV